MNTPSAGVTIVSPWSKSDANWSPLRVLSLANTITKYLAFSLMLKKAEVVLVVKLAKSSKEDPFLLNSA